MTRLTAADLAATIYSAGRVFDGLTTGRLETENFLRSGSLEGVTSRQDLALLQDLRDVAEFIIDKQHRPIDATFVRDVNAQITRSGSLYPGELRRAEQKIGVQTGHGRHEPPAVSEPQLQSVVDASMAPEDRREAALDLFVNLAKVQPFMDGNKRTALFVANALTIRGPSPLLLSVPVDANDPTPARTFNDLLARAYVFDEHGGVKKLLRDSGFAPLT